jgi:hypothetical protein
MVPMDHGHPSRIAATNIPKCGARTMSVEGKRTLMLDKLSLTYHPRSRVAVGAR